MIIKKNKVFIDMNIERRFISIEDVAENEDLTTRAEKAEDGKRYIMGYFSLANSNSVQITERINGELRTFFERISPDAFINADLSDVIYNVEHNISRPIARTGANLQLKVTEKGLFARAELPAENEATTEQNDLYKNVQQKIIRGNSFAFRVLEDEWYRQDGELFRNIKSIGRVVDITSTVSPAYPDTFVFNRSLNEDEIKEIETEKQEEIKEPEQVVFDRSVIDTDFEFSLLKSKQF